MNTFQNRMLVVVGVFTLFTLVGLAFSRSRPWWWATLLPLSIPAWIIGQHIPSGQYELLAGGLCIFGILGTGLGILGLTHLPAARRERQEQRDFDKKWQGEE